MDIDTRAPLRLSAYPALDVILCSSQVVIRYVTYNGGELHNTFPSRIRWAPRQTGQESGRGSHAAPKKKALNYLLYRGSPAGWREERFCKMACVCK